MNEDARAKALSYQASALSLPERQCLVYSPLHTLDAYVAPEVCIRYCCGWGGNEAQRTLLDCRTFVLGNIFNAPNDPGQRDPGSAAATPPRR